MQHEYCSVVRVITIHVWARTIREGLESQFCKPNFRFLVYLNLIAVKKEK
jgi:hypothetical protein